MNKQKQIQYIYLLRSKTEENFDIIHQLRKVVLDQFPNTKKRVENTSTDSGVLRTNFKVFGNVGQTLS